MKDNSHYAIWYGSDYFSLNHENRVTERWWGSRADRNQSFWAEPCLMIQISFVRPRLRITTGYRLCTTDLFITQIATVPTRSAASKLLATILADIKTFPIRKEPGDGERDAH